MQFAGNAALAAALAPGQKREFHPKLMFDWAKDGLYADGNSDMSELFVEATIDRQLAGDFPAEVAVVEGNVAGQLDVVLEGAVISGNPVWKAFSPYAAGWLGTAGAILNTPMYFELVVITALGPVNIRQFTGYIGQPVPARAAGRVTITCYDKPVALQAPISLLMWAVDGFTRTQLTTYPDAPDSGTVALTWVLEDVLRRCGLYQGPAWHPSAVAAWTLNGSALPEIGTTGIEDPYVNGVWSSGYGQWEIPQFTPSGTPAQVYGAGQYGSTCFVGATGLPVLAGRGISYLYGNAHTVYAWRPNVFGSPASNLLGMAGWFKIDPAQSGTSSVLVHLEEAHYHFSGTDQKPAYLQLAVNHASGFCAAVLWSEGWTTSWTFNATTTLTAGWHYVDFWCQFQPGSNTGNFTFDGTFSNSTTGGTAAGIGAFTYSTAPSNTNLAQVIARGPAQYVQVYYQPTTTVHIAPPRVPVNPLVNLDRCQTRLLWLPNISNTAGWDILKAGAKAELGALYVTEAGVVTFDSRTTIKARQTAGASVLDITLDQLDDLSPETTVSSVINSMDYTLHTQHAVSSSTIYATQAADQFQIPAATTRLFPVTNTATQSIRLGNASWHPQAQGYSNPVNPGEYGGAGPSGAFTWKDWMQFYGPTFWYEGFTALTPGAALDSGVQPPEGSGLNVWPTIGFSTPDLDARRMVLNLQNGNVSGGLLEYAVTDNTAFLHIGGTLIVDDGSTTATHADGPSIAAFGSRAANFPSSDWTQDVLTVPGVVTSLVNDTKQATPYFQTVSMVGDPRLQLQDVVTLRDPSGMGATMPASIYGISRRISRADGVADQLTLRAF